MDGGGAVHRAQLPAARGGSACRCCGVPLRTPLAHLGMLPVDLRAVRPGGGDVTDAFRALCPLACDDCRLVQLPGPVPQGSASDEEAPPYEAEALIAALGPDPMTEIATFGGGSATAAFARRGIPLLELPLRFGPTLAGRLRAAGHAPMLIMTQDTLARTHRLHEVLAGLRILLAPGGVVTLDLPYLLPVLRDLRLDALRHDRRSWFSLASAEIALMQHGLAVYGAEEKPSQGGSLRLLARHAEERGRPPSAGMEAVRQREAAFGLDRADPYRAFAAQAAEAKCALLDFLVGARRAGQRVAGVVAPGRGDTLLTYAGVGPELLPFVAEASPHRHGLLLPGTRIPIRPIAAIRDAQPDFVLILAWDREAAITGELGGLRDGGMRFALPGRAMRIF